MALNLKRLFNIQRGERLVHVPSADPRFWFSGNAMLNSWQNFPVPQPGAMSYVYEGITQQAQPFLGRGGIKVKNMPRPFGCTPLVALGTQTVQGERVQLGGIYLQGLVQPQPGPTSA